MRFVRTAENLFGLPLGFTRVEYLESSGTQYIDTGFKPNPTTTKFELSYSTTSSSTFPFGSRVSSNFPSTHSCTSYISSTSVRADWAGSNSVAFSTTSGKINNLICENNKMTLNGSDYQGSVEKSSSYLDYNFLLFNMWDGSSGVRATGFTGKFYKAKLWDNGTLIRDFIPCIDPLGVACMYDLVGKKPYYNQGTGTFTAGRQIIPVDYLYTGDDINCMTSSPFTSTSYRLIDTNETIDLTSVVEIKFAFDKNIYYSGCGLRNSTSSTAQSIYFPAAYSTENKIGWTIGSGEEQRQKFTLDTNDHIIRVDLPNSNVVWDNVNYPIANLTYTPSSRTFPLFAFSDVRATQENGYRFPMQGKIYYAKFWKNGVLTKDFIPCKDENNVGFMFDTLLGTVYLNAGTGAFSVGENKYTSKLRLIKEAKELPDGYKRVEYLESTGEQYIDTEYTINTATDEVLFNFQMISTTLYQWIMGEHDNGARFGIGVGDGTNKRNIAYGATTYKVNDTEIYNSIHYFKANSNGVYLNGTQVHGFETFSSSSTIYLFRLNLSGANGAAGKIWRYVQKRNGSLIRDMIPCLDPNNTPCMFDLVGGKPYYNKGTGSFTYGHTITPVEYLESTGTQYIDTGVTSNLNTVVEMNLKVISYSTNNTATFFGGLSSNIGISTNISKTNTYRYSRFGTKYAVIKNLDIEGITSTIKIDKNAFIINGQSYAVEETSSFSGPNMYLFKVSGVTSDYNTTTDIYSCKLWDNGTLVRSFIPVRDENNVGYMFDEVTGQLFGNAGSGSFGIGNDLPKPKVRFIQDVIPSAYLPLKYLQSTGTQYIDTGVYPTQLTEAEYRCAVTGSVANVDSHLFGSRLSASSEAFDLAYMNTTPNGIEKFRFIHGTTTTQETTTSVTASQLANPHTYYMSGTSFKVDGSEKMSFTTSSFTGSYSLWLFGVNSAGSLHNQVRAQRVYKCIIWDNGVLVRDLYPVLRKSDNKPGMYDKITKQFFVNQGTGEFNYE